MLHLAYNNIIVWFNFNSILKWSESIEESITWTCECVCVCVSINWVQNQFPLNWTSLIYVYVCVFIVRVTSSRSLTGYTWKNLTVIFYNKFYAKQKSIALHYFTLHQALFLSFLFTHNVNMWLWAYRCGIDILFSWWEWPNADSHNSVLVAQPTRTS